MPQFRQDNEYNSTFTIMNSKTDRIKFVTVRFRQGLDQCWVGVKAFLAEKGTDVENLIIADTFPEDHQMIYVLVVGRDRQVYEFYYDWLNSDESNGRIKEWKDLTNTPEAAYRSDS